MRQIANYVYRKALAGVMLSGYALLLLAFLSMSVGVQAQQTYKADWSSLDARPVPQWFSYAKLGIFIHGGV